MEASAEAMTMEQMIAMKEGLEAQIKAMSKPTTDKVNFGPKIYCGGKHQWH